MHGGRWTAHGSCSAVVWMGGNRSGGIVHGQQRTELTLVEVDGTGE